MMNPMHFHVDCLLAKHTNYGRIIKFPINAMNEFSKVLVFSIDKYFLISLNALNFYLAVRYQF